MFKKCLNSLILSFLIFLFFWENVTYAVESVKSASDDVNNNINILSKIFNWQLFINLIFAFVIIVFTFFLSKLIPWMLSRHFEKKIWTDWGNKEEILWVLTRTSSVTILVIWLSAVLTIIWIDMTIFIWWLWFWLWYTIKSFLENFITWIIMVTQGSYHNWDLIKIDWQMWKIKEISSLYTSVEQFDWVMYFIPNKKFMEENVSNYYTNDKRRIDIEVIIDYKNDVYKAKNLMMQIVKKFPNILLAPAPKVMVNKLWEDWVQLILRVWIDSSWKYFSTKSNITETINLLFKQEWIVIPYRNVTITNLEKIK